MKHILKGQPTECFFINPCFEHFFEGPEFVGHAFAYVAHNVFLIWCLDSNPRELPFQVGAQRSYFKLATHLHNLGTHLPMINIYWIFVWGQRWYDRDDIPLLLEGKK